MSHHHPPPRRILTPRKRNAGEAFYTSKPSPVSPAPHPLATASSKAAEPFSSNKLLAGYLAHEFLTKGTLFGQKFDPARAEAVPLSAESRRKKPGQSQSGEAEPSGRVKPQKQSYAEVANLLKSDGTHIPGIVNPTQLARWIQM